MIEDDSVCMVCSEGLHCPVGSTIEKLQAAESASGSRTPFVQKGYHSNSAKHGKTMQNHCQPASNFKYSSSKAQNSFEYMSGVVVLVRLQLDSFAGRISSRYQNCWNVQQAVG